MLQPAGFADELRAALRIGEACWGFLILFRKEEQGPFQQEELQFIRDIAPLIAGRLKAKALSQAAPADSGGQPEEGIIILDDGLEPVSLNPGGSYCWSSCSAWSSSPGPRCPGRSGSSACGR
ncbi:GAF domain-containing protein [Paenibacillus sp. DMB5]|uniref:GAF domain-containing protein n=1 Tax=Paenibacillus sp. DMB5 TaxID=1780103 RepID=UPI00076C9F7E|nr:GAF domain-containing protein [Paenibacillus sp. DMB5]KUP24957.1 hypothetical protein AWJ19_03495 [Paenibacillus sp. DMB5]